MLCALDADPRGGLGRGLQRRRRRRELPHPRDRRDRRPDLPGLRADRSASSGGDTRSYRVSFAKIREHLPAFETAWTAERGARQLRAVFERIGLTREMFEAAPYTRLKELKHLRDTGQLDERLHWRGLQAV